MARIILTILVLAVALEALNFGLYLMNIASDLAVLGGVLLIAIMPFLTIVLLRRIYR